MADYMNAANIGMRSVPSLQQLGEFQMQQRSGQLQNRIREMAISETERKIERQEKIDGYLDAAYKEVKNKQAELKNAGVTPQERDYHQKMKQHVNNYIDGLPPQAQQALKEYRDVFNSGDIRAAERERQNGLSQLQAMIANAPRDANGNIDPMAAQTILMVSNLLDPDKMATVANNMATTQSRGTSGRNPTVTSLYADPATRQTAIDLMRKQEEIKNAAKPSKKRTGSPAMSKTEAEDLLKVKIKEDTKESAVSSVKSPFFGMKKEEKAIFISDTIEEAKRRWKADTEDELPLSYYLDEVYQEKKTKDVTMGEDNWLWNDVPSQYKPQYNSPSIVSGNKDSNGPVFTTVPRQPKSFDDLWNE